MVFYELVKIVAKEWPHVEGYFAFGVNKHGGGLGEYIKALPYHSVKVGQVDEVGEPPFVDGFVDGVRVVDPARYPDNGEVFYCCAGPGDRRGFCFTNRSGGSPKPKQHVAAGQSGGIKGGAVYQGRGEL